MVAEADFELVLDEARMLSRRHRSGGARGQQITCADSEDYWLVSVAYELGRQHQRDSDASLCDALAETYQRKEWHTAPELRTSAECGLSKAAEAIRNNTGDPKCQNQK